MATRTWTGTSGNFTDTTWTGGIAPVSGDTAIISSGTVLASGLNLSGLAIIVNSSATAGGTFDLNASTIAANSTLTLTDYSGADGTGAAVNVVIQGTSTNSGTILFSGTSPNVFLSASSGASLVNNGTIAVNNDGNVYQSPILSATVTGTGTISIGAHGKLDLASSVGSGQTLTFTGGVGAGSVVQVDTPASFNPTISQFVSGDTITVTNTPYTTATYTSTGSGGVLDLFNGSTLTGALNFAGVYTLGSFAFNFTQLDSTHSTLAITTAVVNSSNGATATGAVYRFFDTKFGTHFFTSDVGERNTVLATRADLKEEVNGFGDVSSGDANAVAVYRFFDTNFGTHFFTASASERDGLIATRKDLTYEANSTFYEHATQQSGDVAVYRLFDKSTGTQFLTGDQGEYNGITTPGSTSYRADLRSEGVAFYAPTGSFT